MKIKVYVLTNIMIALMSFQSLCASDPNIAEFGITGSPANHKGFVFIDGIYLESPYVISRKGLALFINDIHIPTTDIEITRTAISEETNFERWTTAEKTMLLAKVEHVKNEYYEYLGQDHMYLFFRDGKYNRLNPYSVIYHFTNIKDIMNSIDPYEQKQNRMKRHKWDILIGQKNVNAFIQRYSASEQLEDRISDLTARITKVNELGIETMAPVHEGFIFNRRQYIETPYTVSRKGLEVYINDILVHHMLPPYLFSKKVYVDPPMPDWFTKNSIYEDIRFHTGEKYRYWRTKYPEDVALSKYREYLKTLPCVKEIQLHPVIPSETKIILYCGEIKSTAPSAPMYDDGRNTDEKRLEMVRKSMEYYDNLLKDGGCIIFRDASIYGASRAGASGKKAKKLLSLLSTLSQSSEPEEEKIQILRESGFRRIPIALREMVMDFPDSVQLKERINEISSNN